MRKLLLFIVLNFMLINVYAFTAADIEQSQESGVNLNSSQNNLLKLNAEIPQEYSFGLGSQYDYIYDIIGDFEYSYYNTPSSGTQEPYGVYDIDIYEDTLKGNVGKIFRNVGVYDGNLVDVKATVLDYELNPNLSRFCTTHALGIVNGIGIYSCAIKKVTLKMEFYVAGTDTPISIKGNTSYWDVDAKQGIVIHDNNTGIYYVNSDGTKEECISNYDAENCNVLNISSVDGKEYIYESDGVDNKTDSVNYAFSETFEGTSITRTYYFSNGSSGIRHSSISFVFVNIPQPKKTVNKEKVKINEEFEYTITQKIPMLLPSYYYKSFKIVDELADVLEADINSVSIYNIDNEDVTEMFELKKANQKIIIRVKDTTDPNLYGKDYIIKIKTKIKDTDLNKYKKDGKYIIPNKATSIYVDYNNEEDSLDSNIVNIVEYKEEAKDKNDNKEERKKTVVEVPDTGISNYIFICFGIIVIIVGIYIYVNKMKKR